MARPKRNSNRRTSRAKTFKAKAAPATPTPPPKIARPPRPTSLPNSAKARAQRAQQGWDDVFATPSRSRDIFGDVLTPTEDQRTEREQYNLENPPRVEIDPMEWWAFEMARQGNDIYLMPYQRTRSINPPRPRTLAAGYMESTNTLFIRFRNGQVYRYDKVLPNVWNRFKAAPSPGRFINKYLNYYPYEPVPDLDRPTGMH